MRRAVIALAGAGVLAGGVALVHLLSGSGAGDPPGAAPVSARPADPAGGLRLDRGDGARSSQEAAALAREVAALRAELAALRDQVASTQGKQPEAARPAVPPERARDPGAREQEQQARRARIEAVEAAFRVEAEDPHWAAGTRSAIWQTLSGDEGLRGMTRAVECRSRTCRVELADDGSGRLSSTLPMVVARLGATLPRMNANPVEEPGGRKGMVLYFER